MFLRIGLARLKDSKDELGTTAEFDMQLHIPIGDVSGCAPG
jgi:hypothetical protein